MGLTIARLIERQGRILIFEGVVMYDGTPLLDTKPYVEHSGPCGVCGGPHSPH